LINESESLLRYLSSTDTVSPKKYNPNDFSNIEFAETTSGCITSPALCTVYEAIEPLPTMNKTCSKLKLSSNLENIFSSSNPVFFEKVSKVKQSLKCKAVNSPHKTRNIILSMAYGYGIIL
jgi:hypothetical protein